MPSTDRRSNRLPQNVKLPKRKLVTINDLLMKDDVRGVFNEIEKVKPYIKDCIVIYIDSRDGLKHGQITDDTPVSLATWMLEVTKLDMLNAESED